jgi:hypothetical protein
MPFDPLENRDAISVVSPDCPDVPYFEYLINPVGAKVHEFFSVGESQREDDYQVLRQMIQEIKISKAWEQNQIEEMELTRLLVIAAWKLKRESEIGKRFSIGRLAQFLPKARSSYVEKDFKIYPRALWAAKQVYAGNLSLENFGLHRSDIKD